MEISNEILEYLPNEEVLYKKRGDCWGSFGRTHRQSTGIIFLSNQRIVYLGDSNLDGAQPLMFEIFYEEVVSIETCTVSLILPTGIQIESEKYGKFILACGGRKEMMKRIQEQISKL